MPFLDWVPLGHEKHVFCSNQDKYKTKTKKKEENLKKRNTKIKYDTLPDVELLPYGHAVQVGEFACEE
jgi:hypothetical protein